MFEQLAPLLDHLGEKRIGILHLGGYNLKFDVEAIVMGWIVIAILVVVALLLRRGLRQSVEEKPTRTQAMLDGIIGFIEGQLLGNFSSESLARQMFPFIATLFLYVLVSNWLSVVPYLSSPTQDLNVTFGLALMVYIVAQVMAVRAKGGRKYLKGFLEPVPFLLPITLVGEISKPLSHAFRLFGNTLAGTILVTVVMVKFAPILVPSGLNLVFGLFFGAIQAFVFAILAVAYIDVAVG